MAQAAHQAGEKEFQFDAVGVETERYKFLAPEEVQPYVRNDGLLNEFKMTYAFRHRFPLHYIVFKQTASHLPHKAKVEQALFSRAGQLVDPNLDPNYLGMMVMVGMNKKNFKPPLKCMKERYYLKFRSGDDDDLSLDDLCPIAGVSRATRPCEPMFWVHTDSRNLSLA